MMKLFRQKKGKTKQGFASLFCNKRGVDLTLGKLAEWILGIIILTGLILGPIRIGYEVANEKFFGGQGFLTIFQARPGNFTPWEPTLTPEEQKVKNSVNGLICSLHLMTGTKIDGKICRDYFIDRAYLRELDLITGAATEDAECTKKYGDVCVKCTSRGSFGLSCEVNNFNLIQERPEDFEAEPWIRGTGDPSYLLYYEAFPEQEASYWHVDMYSISTAAIKTGAIANFIFGPGASKFATKMVARTQGKKVLSKEFWTIFGEEVTSTASNLLLVKSFKNIMWLFAKNTEGQIYKKKLLVNILRNELGEEFVKLNDAQILDLLTRLSRGGHILENGAIKTEGLEKTIRTFFQDRAWELNMLPTVENVEQQIQLYTRKLTDDLAKPITKQQILLIRTRERVKSVIEQALDKGAKVAVKDMDDAVKAIYKLPMKQQRRIIQEGLERMEGMTEKELEEYIKKFASTSKVKQITTKLTGVIENTPGIRIPAKLAKLGFKTTKAGLLSSRDHKLATILVWTIIATQFESANEKLNPQGSNTLYLNKPIISEHAVGDMGFNLPERETDILGDFKEVPYLELIKDEEQTPERLHLVSPCNNATITMNWSHSSCSLSKKYNAYDVMMLDNGDLITAQKGTTEYTPISEVGEVAKEEQATQELQNYRNQWRKIRGDNSWEYYLDDQNRLFSKQIFYNPSIWQYNPNKKTWKEIEELPKIKQEKHSEGLSLLKQNVLDAEQAKTKCLQPNKEYSSCKKAIEILNAITYTGRTFEKLTIYNYDEKRTRQEEVELDAASNRTGSIFVTKTHLIRNMTITITPEIEQEIKKAEEMLLELYQNAASFEELFKMLGRYSKQDSIYAEVMKTTQYPLRYQDKISTYEEARNHAECKTYYGDCYLEALNRLGYFKSRKTIVWRQGQRGLAGAADIASFNELGSRAFEKFKDEVSFASGLQHKWQPFEITTYMNDVKNNCLYATEYMSEIPIFNQFYEYNKTKTIDLGHINEFIDKGIITPEEYGITESIYPPISAEDNLKQAIIMGGLKLNLSEELKTQSVYDSLIETPYFESCYATYNELYPAFMEKQAYQSQEENEETITKPVMARPQNYDEITIPQYRRLMLDKKYEDDNYQELTTKKKLFETKRLMLDENRAGMGFIMAMTAAIRAKTIGGEYTGYEGTNLEDLNNWLTISEYLVKKYPQFINTANAVKECRSPQRVEFLFWEAEDQEYFNQQGVQTGSKLQGFIQKHQLLILNPLSIRMQVEFEREEGKNYCYSKQHSFLGKHITGTIIVTSIFTDAIVGGLAEAACPVRGLSICARTVLAIKGGTEAAIIDIFEKERKWP